MLTEAAGCPTFRVEWVGEEEQGVMGRAGRGGEPTGEARHGFM